MTIPKISLFGFAQSPYVAKTYMYLHYKGLPFEMVYVDPFSFKQLDFAEKRMVPVLKVGEEHRYESTEHGYWLDEVFPDTPRIGGKNVEEERLIRKLDDFTTERLIPSLFRMSIRKKPLGIWYRNGWRNARVMRETCNIPLAIMPMWPVLVGTVDFVKAHASQAETSGTPEQMIEDNVAMLADLIGEGPFLGGLAYLTLADLSAYAQVSTAVYIGYEGREDYLSNSTVMKWVNRIESHLKQRPTLVPPEMQVRRFPLGSDA